MKRLFFKMIMLGLAAGYCGIARSQAPIFKNGEKVAFVGNSITYAGGFLHDIALFYATRYPDVKIEVYNCGVPGNVAAQVLARMESDILINKPTVSIVKLGMNDVHKELYTAEANKQPDIQTKRQQVLDVFRRDYEQVIQLLQKSGSKVILQTPTIYDETAALKDMRLHGRNAGLAQFAACVKELGEKYKLPVVDYRTPMVEITQKIQSTDSTKTIIGPDRVHPGGVGHFIMAYTFIKTMQGAMPVSALTLNAISSNKINGVSSFAKKAGTISFTWLEKALPYPVPADAAPALNLVPFSADLNLETLKISNLQAGNYKLSIDGIAIGNYTQGQLSEGVDLAQNKLTPQYQQAQKILTLFQQMWAIESKLRYIKALQAGRAPLRNAKTLAEAEQYFEGLLKVQKDTTSQAYKDVINLRNPYLATLRNEQAMRQQVDQLRNQIYTDNKPLPHRFEIVRQ